MSHRYVKPLIAASLLAAIGFMGLWWSGNTANPISAAHAHESPDHDDEVSPDDMIMVEGLQLGNRSVVGGTVIPAREVTLTAQLPGQIIWLGGREGDRFTQYSELVEIEADELEARLDAAWATLDTAEADIRNAEVQYQREIYSPSSRSISRSGGMGLPSLFDQMVTRPFSDALPGDYGGDRWMDRRADLYSSRTRLDQARGRYRQIESQIDEIEASLSEARVYTPFPGIILDLMVERGDMVQPGMPLMRFAELDHLQVEAQIPARLAPKLSLGDTVSASIDDGYRYTRARVAQKYPSASSERRTVTFKFDLENFEDLIPGMYVELQLPGDSRSADVVPVVPLDSIRFKGSLPTVRVVGPDNVPQRRMIRLGENIDQDRVVVLGGLKPGEWIMRRP